MLVLRDYISHGDDDRRAAAMKHFDALRRIYKVYV
jgi:hypothetical protein